MSTRFDIRYVDRDTGRVGVEPVFAARFLDWSYNTRVGRTVTQFVLSRPVVSRGMGFLARRAWTRRLVPAVARRLHIDPSECDRPLGAYRDIEHFFTRELRPGCRPLPETPDTCVSPVDGRLLVHSGLSYDRTFRIKRTLFNLRRLLRDDTLARQYVGGTVIICRLTLADYHHVHFPVFGIPHPARALSGRLYAGGPYGRRRPVPYFTDNYRMVTVVDSDHFGRVTMVEVGAFTVGSIVQRFRPGEYVEIGMPKAYFELGGSTVVLLLQPGAIACAPDLVECSRRGLELRVHFGEPIGRAIRHAHTAGLTRERALA